MRYLLLIYESEKAHDTLTQPQRQQEFQEYIAYSEELRKVGAELATEALMPVATATTVRRKNGQIVCTDGPYAETKEQLGGFYLIEAKDLDEAIAWASKIPALRLVEGASIEVRPVIDFSTYQL